MIDPNTKFEIQNEVEIFCEDLRMMTLVTDQLFSRELKWMRENNVSIKLPVPTEAGFSCNPCECGGHPDCPECGNWPESDGYLGSGRP